MNQKEYYNLALASTVEEIKNIQASPIYTKSYGKISSITNHGLKEIVETTYTNGNRHRKFYKIDDSYAKGIVAKMYLEDQVGKKLSNYDLYKKVIDNLTDENPEDSYKSIQQKLPSLNVQEIEYAIVDVLNSRQNQSSSLGEKYTQAIFKEHEKVHPTSRGIKLRSKSEVFIAEKLYEYNLEFIYEPGLYMNGKRYAPDFVIQSRSGKEYFWEHFGLSGNGRYIKNQLIKIQDYIDYGIKPWDNLIITYDTYEGVIDQRIILSEIKNKLL